MAKVNVSIPQGTRDFGPETVRKRNYIFDTIRNVFELYGFQPLETPAMENLETLMGKYGEEGDKLIFKILNNGLDNPAKEKQAREDFEKILQGKNTTSITERALRYDLTIPFARYVAMNYGQEGNNLLGRHAIVHELGDEEAQRPEPHQESEGDYRFSRHVLQGGHKRARTTKLSDRSQPPVVFDLCLREPAGSGRSGETS